MLRCVLRHLSAIPYIKRSIKVEGTLEVIHFMAVLNGFNFDTGDVTSH